MDSPLNVLKNWSEIRFRCLDIASAAWRICSHIRIVVTQLVKKDTDHRKGTCETIQYYTYTQINRYRFCSMNDLFSYSYRSYPVSKNGNRCKSTWETIQLYTYAQIKIKEQLLERNFSHSWLNNGNIFQSPRWLNFCINIPANFLSTVINDGNCQLKNIFDVFGHRRSRFSFCYQWITIFSRSR